MTDTTSTDMLPLKPIKNQSRPSGQLLLGIMMTLGFFGVLVLAMFKPIPTENHDIVIALLGALSTLIMSTWAFYFGSSIGSRTKDDLINSGFKALPDNNPHQEKTTATANVTIKSDGA